MVKFTRKESVYMKQQLSKYSKIGMRGLLGRIDETKRLNLIKARLEEYNERYLGEQSQQDELPF